MLVHVTVVFLLHHLRPPNLAVFRLDKVAPVVQFSSPFSALGRFAD